MFTINCPLCQKTLNVPEEAVGKKVKCPSCQGVFAVEAPSSTGISGTPKTSNPPPPPSKSGSSPWDKETESERRRREEEEEDDRRRRRRDDDEDDDDRRGRSKRRRDDDEDDDDDRRGRRRRRRDNDFDFGGRDDDRYRRPMEPSRGGTVMTLGILSCCICCIPIVGIALGASAVNMANADGYKYRSGRMDPSGEGSSSTGRAFGIVGIILSILMICVAIGLQAGAH